MTDVDHVLTNKEFFQMNIVEIVPKDKELIPCPKFVEFALMDKEFFQLDFVEFALMEKALLIQWMTTNAGHAQLDKEFFKLEIVELALMEKALIQWMATNAGHAQMDRYLILPQIFVLSHRTFLFQSMLRQTLNKVLETREMTFIY